MRSKLVLALLALATVACLPADDRPPPGILTVNLTSDDSLGPDRKPFETSDGWTISFESFVMSIGYTRLGESSDCADYAGSVFGPGRGYNRLLDLNAAETQRISAIRLIGTCSLGFWNREPEDDSVLGEGVSEELREELREKKNDLFTSKLGTILYVKGEATNGDRHKTFEWSFRQAIRRVDCQLETDAGIERGVQLDGEETRTYELFTRGEILFRTTFDGDELSFGRFAKADDEYGNADGEIELEEMALLPVELPDGVKLPEVPELPEDIDLPEGVDLDEQLRRAGSYFGTLAGYVYIGLVPELVRFRKDGVCKVDQALDENMERALRQEER